jgi:EAL domain-containing protein (putative c-di-GMP-specific phosphodiesterase class I)
MAFDIWATQVAKLASYGTTLVAEICELTALDDQRLVSRLRLLQRSRVEVALDDFGRGRALFDRIQAFEWDYCKVALRGLASGQARDLARESARRAKAFRIVCEEVEHIEDMDRIARFFGPSVVEAAQGYALHRPEVIATEEGQRCA